MTRGGKKKVEVKLAMPGALLQFEVEAHFVWAVVGAALVAVLMNAVGYAH